MAQKIKVWVELRDDRAEELHEVPDNWDQLTAAERLDHMENLYSVVRDDVVSGGYTLVED